MERGTEYGLEQVYSVIDSRYRSGKPLIATTNLTLEEILVFKGVIDAADELTVFDENGNILPDFAFPGTPMPRWVCCFALYLAIQGFSFEFHIPEERFCRKPETSQFLQVGIET